MTSIDIIIMLSSVSLGIYAVFSSLEYLSIRDLFAEEGLLSWEILRLSYEDSSLRILKPLLANFEAILIVRLLSGFLLIVAAIFTRPISVIVLFIFISDILILVRIRGGLSGSAHMSLVISGGLLIATIFSKSDAIQTISLAFIATQGILSYVVAGVAKGIGDSWRDGTAIEMIFTTRSWGDDRIIKIIQKYPAVKRVGAISVIVLEISFMVSLFVGSDILLVMFASGIVFHMFNSVFMGLNDFIYIFPGTYPSIYYINQLHFVSV